MQFGHDLAQLRPVGRRDGARDPFDKFVTDLALFIPHRQMIEGCSTGGSRGGLGNVDILGHAAPPRFDRMSEVVLSYRSTQYPIGND